MRPSSTESGLTHKFYSPFTVAGELLRGRSLTRSLFHCVVQQEAISGRVLDLGGGRRDAVYFQHLKMDGVTEVVHTDLQPRENVVMVDVEQPFPFADEEFDTIIAFHLFEHVYRFQTAPQEAFRVLRPSGRVLLAVPFLYPFHASPGDFYRYTDVALNKIWNDAGFECERLQAVGEGLFTTFAATAAEQLLPRWARSPLGSLAYLVTTPLDRLVARVRPRLHGRTVPERFAMEFFAVFRKPGV